MARGDWKDADDLEGSFRVGWDNNNLYVAFKMIDDEYVQNATGADLYKGDGLEILIDTNLNADFSVTELNSDDYQIGISPGKPDVNGTREAYVWYPASVAGPRTQIQIASARGAGVTRIEVAIPWTVLGITPVLDYGSGLSSLPLIMTVRQTMSSRAWFPVHPPAS